MAKKKSKTTPASKNLTIRLSGDDRDLFDRASKLEHFDSLAQWIKVHLRRIATDVIEAEEQAQAAKDAAANPSQNGSEKH